MELTEDLGTMIQESKSPSNHKWNVYGIDTNQEF